MFVVTLQLPDGRFRYVEGDGVTMRREHATRFPTHGQALAAAERWVKKPEVRDAWPSLADPSRPEPLVVLTPAT